MWIKREQYEANLRRTAKLEVEVESKQGQIVRLQKEIDYWREKFESAQNRADRIVDKSLATSGIGPISDLGKTEFEEVTGRYAKMMKESERTAIEMFGEEIPSEATEEVELQIDEKLASALVEGLKE